jgi:HlyD family secretion protein
MRDASGKSHATPAESASENKAVQTAAAARAPRESEGVFVVEGKRARFRKVKTGTTDNTHIVVLSGLKAGESVVSGSYGAISRELHDGSAIKKQEKP